MVLSHTPPKGADKAHGITKTDLLLQHIERLGNDRFGNPIGIRCHPLSAATGVPATSIPVLLAKHVQSGRLCACKISVPGSGTAPQTEYRKGGGVAAPDWKPLDAKRAKIARQGADQPAKTQPQQTKRLGYFMGGSERIWNPF